MKIDRIERDFAGCRDAVVGVYRAAYSLPPYNATEESVAQFAEGWAARIQHRDFRLVLASDEDEIIGMAYGWTSEPRTYWHEKMADQLVELAEYWLADCFAFVDIAVKPSAQGRGAGKALYSALFADLPNSTSLLYTHQSDTAAFQMYQKLGWTVLREELTLSSGKQFVLMGKRIGAVDSKAGR